MAWFQMMVASQTAAVSQFAPIQSAASTDCDTFILHWNGLQESFFDGYECTDGPDQVTQFTANTNTWPNRIQWGGKNRGWIRVTMGANTVATGQQKVFNFYYTWTGQLPDQWPRWNHIDEFTGEFSPICIEQEIAPETFLKWLEKIGHDDAYLRVSYKMQKKMMKATGHLPPWDPRKIKELEEGRQRFLAHARELTERGQEILKDRLYERWGIREIPPITPEMLDQIVENSTNFLKECLSEEELKWYDEEGHIKVRSTRNSNIFYVIEKKAHGTIEKWVNNEHTENICYQSKMSRLPLNDNLAMKVLDVKYNEEEFLRVGNSRRILVRH
ncbi:hypothetical protein LCGC14_1598800 [marine sediment metagenome]|uniref:Uncharacterized protein n=1 Tax=marine sediment metagenome TaxID=412755 RepID=A0A0F9IBS1_9ZZZZ